MSKKIFEDLSLLYNKIPETTGCMDWILKPENEGGCSSWCCSKQQPNLLSVEFKLIWNFITNNWSKESFLILVEKALTSYVFNSQDNPCIFLSKENKCTIHDKRPYNCRIYGIIPEEEFKPRYERLKVIYPNTRNQCSLVKTVDGKTLSKKDIDEWWSDLCDLEKQLGIDHRKIHDGYSGSYRNFYEHVILELMGEDSMMFLQKIRVEFSEEEKKDTIQRCIIALGRNIK